MSQLSDVKRYMIIEARPTEASMSRIGNLVGISRTTISRVMTAYKHLGKVSSAKRNSGRKSNWKDRDGQNPISMKAIQCELHAANIHGRVAVPKPLVSAVNAMKRPQWRRDHLNWTQL
ncbi:transposable element Tc1 transposase [Trichonephila clavipes]|nr:transposable element Tc1 transposase [Trichonephila clavipes]